MHVYSLKPEELENGATTTAPHVTARYVLVPGLCSLPDLRTNSDYFTVQH
jgi:hypothetical protein